jgi:hypothetical protein
MILSRKLWITPQTICLNTSVWCILHRSTKDNSLMTSVSWGTQNAPNKSLRERMSTHPTPMSGQEDIEGSTLYLFTYDWHQDSNQNFYCRFPTILDKGRQTDIILFQRCHLLALQSGGISFNALGNARGISVCVHTKRNPPCMLGDWAHCATGEDSWQ